MLRDTEEGADGEKTEAVGEARVQGERRKYAGGAKTNGVEDSCGLCPREDVSGSFNS